MLEKLIEWFIWKFDFCFGFFCYCTEVIIKNVINFLWVCDCLIDEYERWIFGEADCFQDIRFLIPFQVFFILIMLFLKNSYNDFFLTFWITVESKFLLCLYLSCVLIFLTGSFSLMYFLNKESLTKIVLWIAAVIYGFVFNFNWYWLTFLNETCLSSTSFMFKRKSS